MYGCHYLFNTLSKQTINIWHFYYILYFLTVSNALHEATECVSMCFTSICARVLSLGLLRYSCSSRASDGKNCPPGNAAEKLTLSTFPASASGCTLNTNTSSGETESTADTPSRKWVSSGDRKCSWDMFWRRTVMLLLSISSVMMRTRNTHWALMLWMPSEKQTETKEDEVS